MVEKTAKKIVIITSGSIRHSYFRMGVALSPGINVLASFVETSPDDSTGPVPIGVSDLQDPLKMHFSARNNTEYDFFGPFISLSEDKSKPVLIPKGAINEEQYTGMIEDLNPEVIVTYGCSIIREPLLKLFPNRIINVHLGMSPYYRGSGTNFHAMARGDFQCVGVTYMFMDSGIDTGPIIHQRRAKFFPFDNPHQVGNRLIAETVFDVAQLVRHFDSLEVQLPHASVGSLVFKRKDASTEVTESLYRLFEENAVVKYLSNRQEREEKYPIIEQPCMRSIA